MNNNISIEGICDLLKNREKIMIFSHKRPDGDTLGSAFALKYMLLEMGKKEVFVFCSDKIPERLMFLTDGQADSCIAMPEGFLPELSVAVDVASYDLIGDKEGCFCGTTLKIDHHLMGDDYAEYNYTDPSVAATGEIIFQIAERLGTKDRRAYERIYGAISSDTGCFKYRNVTPHTHYRAGKIIEKGIDNYEINRRLFENKSVREMTAERISLNAMQYYNNNTVAVINFTNDMKNQNSLTDEDINDIASIPRTVEGVVLGIVIKQNTSDDKKYKISMRSGKNINAAEICASLGGGGHFNAAGAEVTADSPEEAEKIVLKAAGELSLY